jgi:hypothetical protein
LLVGSGGGQPFRAHCDQEFGEGGWTLLLKADGEEETFRYGAALWTNEATLNEADVGIDRIEHKSAAFHRVVGERLRVVMREGEADPMEVDFWMPRTTLSGLIEGDVYTQIPGPEGTLDDWRAVMDNPNVYTFHWPEGAAERCAQFGINAWDLLRIGAHSKRYMPHPGGCNGGLGNWIGVGHTWTDERLTDQGVLLQMPSVGNGYKNANDGRVEVTRATFAYVYVR